MKTTSAKILYYLLNSFQPYKGRHLVDVPEIYCVSEKCEIKAKEKKRVKMDTYDADENV